MEYKEEFKKLMVHIICMGKISTHKNLENDHIHFTIYLAFPNLSEDNKN
jgi:hypothetical protein